MDGFVLAISGDPNVRKIQQNLNRDYYKTIGLIPCNGVYSRDTNRALIKALQVEEGTTLMEYGDQVHKINVLQYQEVTQIKDMYYYFNILYMLME